MRAANALAATISAAIVTVAGRVIRDPRINTAALASSLSKGKYPYHAADIASEEIQAKLAAVDWPGGKPLVHPVSSPLTGERNNLISPFSAAEKAMRTQLEASSGGGGDAFERAEEMREARRRDAALRAEEMEQLSASLDVPK